MSFIRYAEGLNAPTDVLQWVEKRLTEAPVTDGEHIIDYLLSDKRPKRLDRMTYEQAKEKAEKWSKAMQKKGEHIQETEEDTETVLDFGDGFRIAKLVGKPAFEREGYLMRHCVASYHGRDTEVYSLRDADNMPHCTMERDNQIKGKGNGSIHPRYVGYVVKFLEHVGMEVRESEMANLGYINVTKWKKHLSKDTVSELFNKQYHYRENPMIGKDGEQFHCFEELDTIPLVEETRTGVRLNFDIPTFVPLSVKFLLDVVKSKTKKLTDNGEKEKKIGSSGDYAQIGSSGYSARIGSSGYYAQIGSSGDYAQIGSSGYSAQIGSSGYSARIGSEGEDAVVAAIGPQSKISAKKGSWITLAEYDDNRKPLCVRSAQIDGKTLKADVLYELKNGEFTEVTE